MEFNFVFWLISFLPILLLLVLISYINLSIKWSALISLSLACILAYYMFEVNLDQLAISAGKGAMLSLYVILIIVGAVLLYNIVDIAGGFNSMELYLNDLGGDKTLKLLGLCWAFSSFIQGITGFGVPVAIVGAVLVGIGYKPMIALTTVLIGHSWAISFGSMGSSFYALMLVTRLDSVILGTSLALLFFLPILTTGIFSVYVYGGIKSVKKQLKYILPIGVAMGLMQLAAARFGFPHIGALLGGLMGSALFMVILIYKTDDSIRPAEKGIPLKAALIPYIVLISTVLITQIPYIANILPDWELAFSFPGYTTGLGFEVEAEANFSPIGLFSHPFFFLVLASLVGFFYYARNRYLTFENIKAIFNRSYKKSSSSVTTVFLLMILASIMSDSGMIYTFAQGMALLTGSLFPIISPIIGILGAFLTGSNTSSNVLFGAFQMDTANILGYSSNIIASSQSVGGSLGSAIAPAKIIMGTAVVGLEGAEGDLVKKCLGYTLISGLIVGVAVFIVLNFI